MSRNFEDLGDDAQNAIISRIADGIDAALPSGFSPTGKMPFVFVAIDRNNQCHFFSAIPPKTIGEILRHCADMLDPPTKWPPMATN